MTGPDRRERSLHYSIGILAISAGSLLLAIHHYSTVTADSLISLSALGILLLILAAVLVYAGIRKSYGNISLCVTFYWTVSSLWCGSGINFILARNNVLIVADMKNAMVPGLAAFTLGLFIIGVVGILQNEAVVALMAFALSLSSAHEIALFFNSGVGSSVIACNYLIVTFIGVYFFSGRALYFLSKMKVRLPGTDISRIKDTDQGLGVHSIHKIELATTCLILNMLASSVFGCRLLNVTNNLFIGQVAWLWTAAVYQTGLCILSYRSFKMLDATCFAFFSILRYAEGYSLLYQYFETGDLRFPIPLFVVFSILFFIMSLFACIKNMVDSVYLLFFVAYCISLACNPSAFFSGGSQGINVAIYVASAIALLINLYNGKSSVPIPTGEGIMQKLFANRGFIKIRQEKDVNEPYLGYSKYIDADVLAHAGNMLAAFAMTVPGNPAAPLLTVVLPWVVVAGGLYNLICGSVAFSRGKTLESSAFILYGIMWVIWGITRYGGLYGPDRSFNTAVGIICFILFNTFIVFTTLFLSKAWFAYALTFELILISFLLDSFNRLPNGYDIAVTIIFGLVSFYCFLATLFNSTFEGFQIPIGSPFIKISGFSETKNRCPHLISTRTSSVRQIAEIMKNGGICGIPTDTVYVLVAACNQPDAVERAYKTKRQAQDRPMSLWISNLKQLEPAKHLFSPLVWDFMQAAWPSSISLVIPRGEWLEVLGAKDSSKYIGTPQSIAIRIPDCSVTTHLIDMVGPIAVTSANPSGEADTTHHNQVYAKLGDNVDGVLCDGASPENIASTVVDCTKIDSGNIGFFRVGIVPKSQVLEILHKVQQKHKLGCDNLAYAPSIENLADLENETRETENTANGSNGSHSYDNGAFTLNEDNEKL
uniref:Threonylcarbamoyl-AMP synthase n=1 Tax=Leptobrachium leishanense TaxID=445787 RepID=A0A8C5MM91_9ANUR